MTQDTQQKFGHAALIGLPNAGKSTLTNALVGEKVSIVTHKKQTTRTRITGIMMHENAQILLMDTPGIFSAHKSLERAMVGAAWGSIEEADVIIHIVDAALPIKKNIPITQKLPHDKPCFLVLNKIDRVKKEKLLQLAQAFNDQFPYAATFMIIAKDSKGLDNLKTEMAKIVPDGEWVYDADDLTTLPMRMMAAEITREKIYEQLHEELPYAIFVETETWETQDNGAAHISQVICVERDTQKAIVLGKGGSQIKKIGGAAREDMKELFGYPVHLELFVKVNKNWSEDPETYHKMGLPLK